MGQKKISDLPAASAITGAELIELVQSGASVQSTVNGIKNGAVKVYRALLSQTGTAAPVATILENTLGGVPVWGRNNIGFYTITLAGAFSSSNIAVPQPCDVAGSNALGLDFGTYFYKLDNNSMELDVYDVDNNPREISTADAMILFIEILIYP